MGFLVYASKDQKNELKRRADELDLSLSAYLVRRGLDLPLERHAVSIKNLVDSIPAIPVKDEPEIKEILKRQKENGFSI